jgi:hypothetical protein
MMWIRRSARVRARAKCGAAFGLALSLACVGAAQEGPQQSAAEERATSFQAVQGPSKEHVAGGPLLISAYGFVLAALLGYVARLALLQRRTSADLERIGRLLEQKREA